MNLATIPIKELATVSSGGSAPQDPNAFSESGHPFVRAGSLPKLLDGAEEQALEKLEMATASKHGLRLFPAGTVLFAKSGMSATKGHVYKLEGPAYVVSHLAALVPHDPRDSGFLVRALEKYSPTSLIRDPAYPSIRLPDIEDFQIEGPNDVAERSRITAILDQADDLRRRRRDALERLNTLRQAIFLDMFGDPATNPKNWNKGTIEDALTSGLLLEIQDGNHGERHPKVSNFSPQGVPFITANCLANGKLDVSKAYKLDPSWLRKLRIGFAKAGDLLLSHKGTIGEVAVVPSWCEDLILSPQVTYYRIGVGLNVQFLAGYFRTSNIQAILAKDAEQSTRAYIGITRQRALPIFFPPILLQQQFAERIFALELLEDQCGAAAKALNTLFTSLQDRAFRGEL